MAKKEVLSLNEGTPQIVVPQTGDTYTMPRDVEIDADLTVTGTINGSSTVGGAFSADAQTQITPTTAIVLDEATGNEIALDLSYTVNKAAGNDTGLLINQTDTASPGTSLLADFQVGGVSLASIDNAGNAVFGTSNKFQTLSNGAIQINNNAGQIFASSNVMTFYTGTLARAAVSAGGFVAPVALGYLWSSAANPAAAADTGFARDSAGVVKVTNGSTGNGALRAKHLEAAEAYTVATLPTPSVGMIARVTDATAPAIGSTVTGGGAAYALCNYNGSNWTVIGI